MWEPFNVGLEPQLLHDAMIWWASVNQHDLSQQFSKSGPTSWMVMAGWQIHITIQRI